MVKKRWTAVAIQLQGTWITIRHVQQSTKKCSRDWGISTINDQLYEVELAKSEIEHKEPICVGFFILQYAKLRLLELYYCFFTNLCDTDKYEEMEMDTD